MLSSKRTFNEKRPGGNYQTNGESSSGNANEQQSIKETVEQLYTRCLEFGYLYKDLYDMTIKELIDTINARSRMLGYQMWKEAHLIGWAAMNGKSYPRKPEKASPELYPKPKTIKMPDNLLKRYKGA